MGRTTYVLAHDLGTSADKATLFTIEGAFVDTVTTPYPTYVLPNGGVEQDPEDMWGAFCRSTKAILTRVGIDPARIAVVGFDGTFPGCLCLDKDGRPLGRSLIWQDARAAQESAELEERLGKEWLSRFTNPRLGTDKTICKLLWLSRHDPERIRRTWKVLPSSQDFVVWRLVGGEPATERLSASSTRLVGREHGDWSEEACALVGMGTEQMPRLVGRTDVVGTVLPGLAEETGLVAGTPVVHGTGDSFSADVGAGMLEEGDAYLTGGTSGGIYSLARADDGSLRRIGGEASASGASMSWLKNVICVSEQGESTKQARDVFDLIDEEAARAPIGCHGTMFHPYLSGERWPRFDPKAQGSFTGISQNTTRPDLLRAVIEGIGLNMANILDILSEQVRRPSAMPMVGGLAKGPFVRQTFADILDVELLVPRNPAEMATIGTAVLASIGIGAYEDEAAGFACFSDFSGTTVPDPEAVEAYRAIRPVYDEVYQAMRPVYPHICDVRARLSALEQEPRP